MLTPRRKFMAVLGVMNFIAFVYALYYLLTGSPNFGLTIGVLGLAIGVVGWLRLAFGYGQKKEKRKDKIQSPEEANWD